MTAIAVQDLSYRYGRVVALDHVTLEVPEGSVCALLGPNGAGKTTLLEILAGLRRARGGEARIMGIERAKLTHEDRQWIGYVAAGRPLPGWMRLEEVERWLAPLYPSWDAGLADRLRERFGLDPARKVKTLSRGEAMKAALLCALAPRPRVHFVMDVMRAEDWREGNPGNETVNGTRQLPSDEVIRAGLKRHLPDAARIEIRGSTLKEIFVANVTSKGVPSVGEVR